MGGIFSESLIHFRCCTHSRGCGSYHGIRILQCVRACAHILVVVLNLVLRVAMGIPFRKQRDVFSDRITAKRPGTGQAFILIPSAKPIPGPGWSRRCGNLRCVPYSCQVGHRTSLVFDKIHSEYITVIIELQHQRPIGCNRPAGNSQAIGGVLGETRVALCCRSCRRSRGPCQILGFIQSVTVCAHILLVMLHLVGRIGVGSPLRIQCSHASLVPTAHTIHRIAIVLDSTTTCGIVVSTKGETDPSRSGSARHRSIIGTIHHIRTADTFLLVKGHRIAVGCPFRIQRLCPRGTLWNSGQGTA